MPAGTISKPKRPGRLASKLAQYFLLGSLLIIIFIVVLVAYSVLRTQQQSITRELELIAQSASHEVGRFFEHKILLLEHSTKEINFHQNLDSYDAELNMLLSSDSTFRQIFIKDAAGKTIGNVSRASVLASQVPDRAWIETQKGNYFSSVYIDPSTSEPLILVAISARDLFGQDVGIVAA